MSAVREQAAVDHFLPWPLVGTRGVSRSSNEPSQYPPRPLSSCKSPQSTYDHCWPCVGRCGHRRREGCRQRRAIAWGVHGGVRGAADCSRCAATTTSRPLQGGAYLPGSSSLMRAQAQRTASADVHDKYAATGGSPNVWSDDPSRPSHQHSFLPVVLRHATTPCPIMTHRNKRQRYPPPRSPCRRPWRWRAATTTAASRRTAAARRRRWRSGHGRHGHGSYGGDAAR